MYSRNVQQNPLCVESSCVTKVFSIFPRFSPRFFIAIQIQYFYKYYYSTPLYSCINRLYVQNPVFEIVREESVKVYLHMYNGNVQQNTLCVESCFTKEYSISPGSRQRCLIPMQIQSSFEHLLRRAERNKSLTEFKMKEVPNIDLRREDTKKSRNGILIGQCAQFLVHPSPN